MNQPFIRKYRVNGLQYYHNFEIEFIDSCRILVGENGLGKTTILNILYATLAKKWAFLIDCAFDFIEIEFKNSLQISFSHTELDAYMIEKYVPHAEQYGIPSRISEKFSLVEHTINTSLHDQIVYLPAFRNIKEDLMILGRDLEDVKKTSSSDLSNNYDEDFSSIEHDILIPFKLDYLNRGLLIAERYSQQFVNTCNSYLVNTCLIFDKATRVINLYSKYDLSEQVPITQLSSGEKQILYIFSKIYLNHNSNLSMLIDEPEMSLSLKWQRKILVDIFDSGRCSFLFAITHSPFIFDNKLDKYAEGINIYLK